LSSRKGGSQEKGRGGRHEEPEVKVGSERDRR